ncbi:Aspartyl protease family protein 2 [Linum perenne]
MDTGSSLTWVKCAPCMPCMPSITLFDPANSKTYKPLPCTEDCRRCTEKRWSWSTKKCLFSINYLGGQHVLGVYATDQLTFRTSNNSTAVIPNVTFGCSSLVAGLGNNQDPRMTGVLGLGGLGANGRTPSDEPLITKLGSKFSYCIGSVLDRSYLYNHLTISDDADLLGFSTPFYSNKNGDYFVHLTNISLGDSVINIIYLKMSKEGIMVDSGTEVMFLHEEAFEVVKAEVKKLGSSNLTETRSKSGLELCYKGLVNVDARDQFPNMDLQFKDGADLLIDNTGMFIQVDDNTFCLAVIRTKGVSIIGVMAQQGYNVGYDLKGSRIYFQDLDCQILEARKF